MYAADGWAYGRGICLLVPEPRAAGVNCSQPLPGVWSKKCFVLFGVDLRSYKSRDDYIFYFALGQIFPYARVSVSLTPSSVLLEAFSMRQVRIIASAGLSVRGWLVRCSFDRLPGRLIFYALFVNLYTLVAQAANRRWLRNNLRLLFIINRAAT